MVQVSRSVKVWDPLQRVLNWGLVLSIAVCWWAGEERLSLHVAFGYAVLAIAGSRSAWGWVGSRHARFSSFVRGPGVVLRYLRDIVQAKEHRYLGHNPLGGWMVLALLLCIAVICITGIMYTTDAFWGIAWVDITHRASAWTLVGLVLVHLAGVVFTSWRHRENLVAAMIGGRKRAGEHDDKA